MKALGKKREGSDSKVRQHYILSSTQKDIII